MSDTLSPKTALYGLGGPNYDWAKLMRKGIEGHVLPVHPRGMLVEPFVEELATGRPRTRSARTWSSQRTPAATRHP